MVDRSDCTQAPVAGGGEALRHALENAPDGATLCLAAGEYRGPFVVRRNVTIVGRAGETTLLGSGEGPVVFLETPGVRFGLADVTVRGGGDTRGGGGLFAPNGADIDLRHVVFSGNRALGVGGGAVFTKRGTLRVTATRFEHNEGATGGAALIEGLADAAFAQCVFAGNAATNEGGALAVRDDAAVALHDCRFENNRAPAGTAVAVRLRTDAEAPVTLHDVAIDGPLPAAVLVRSGRRPAVVVRGALTPAGLDALPGVQREPPA